MIRFSCTSCDAAFKVKDEHAGKRVKCPKCGTPNTVPDGEGDGEADDAAPPAEVPVARKRPAGRRRAGGSARGGGRRKIEAEGTPKWLLPAVILALVAGAIVVALQYMGGPDYGKMYSDADDLLTENRAAEAVALLEQIPTDDGTSLSQKVEEKLEHARKLAAAKEDRASARLGTNVYNLIETLDKRVKDMGNTDPDYAPTTRYLLKRVREFEQDYPDHEMVDEARALHSYYRNVASLDTPPTEADVRTEINYRSFANRFDHALDAIDEFARRSDPPAELLDTLRQEVRTRAYEDWASDKQQANDTIANGKAGQAESNLRKLLPGYAPYPEITQEIEELIARAESKPAGG